MGIVFLDLAVLGSVLILLPSTLAMDRGYSPMRLRAKTSEHSSAVSLTASSPIDRNWSSQRKKNVILEYL